MKNETILEIDAKKVLVSKLNTRQPTAAECSELIASIKATGQISPAIVRKSKKLGHYELAAGARRKMACQALGIPLKLIVREIPDDEFEDIILTDNLQRSDPDPMQEAILIERRIAAGAEPSEIAARYGKSDTWLKRRMKLLGLTEAVRNEWKPEGDMAHFTTEMMEYVGTMTAEEQDELAGNRYDCREMISLASMLDSIRCRAKNLDGVTWLHDPVSFVEGCGPGCVPNTAEGLFPDPDHPCGLCVNTTCFRKREKLVSDAKLADLLGGKPITDFILFRSKGYASNFDYQGKDHKTLSEWQFKQSYTKVKKPGPNTHAGLDLADGEEPSLCHLKLKAGAKPKEGDSSPAPAPLPGKSDSREDKLTAKRYAALNQYLDNEVSTAEIPTSISMLRLAAAFGMDAKRDYAGDSAWDSLDSETDVPGLDFTGDRVAPEQAIWNVIKPILRRRLSYSTNKELLDERRQTEMLRIGKLVGFDHEAKWLEICTKEIPVPKSWGPGIDPVTLAAQTDEEKRTIRQKKDDDAVESVRAHAISVAAAQKARDRKRLAEGKKKAAKKKAKAA